MDKETPFLELLNVLCGVRRQGPRLDWAYVREWSQRLELATDLQSLQKAAGI